MKQTKVKLPNGVVIRRQQPGQYFYKLPGMGKNWTGTFSTFEETESSAMVWIESRNMIGEFHSQLTENLS